MLDVYLHQIYFIDLSPDFGRTPSFAQHRSSELRLNSQIRLSACQIFSGTSFNTRFLFYMGGINILEKEMLQIIQ